MSRKTTPKTPVKETNGALQASATVAPLSSSPAPAAPKHQTHGGYTPIRGPITSARQLVRSKNLRPNDAGSFETVAAYGAYLRGLTLAELHRHAVEDIHIVAIDDRERLIKRLEVEWTGIKAHESAGSTFPQPPKRAAFTAEQIAKQEEIKQRMLRGR